MIMRSWSVDRIQINEGNFAAVGLTDKLYFAGEVVLIHQGCLWIIISFS